MKFYQKNVHRPILVGYKHSATSKLATRFCTSLWNERSPKPATFKGKTWFSLRENLIFLWFFSLFFQKFPTKYLFHSTKKNRLLKKNKNYENGKNIFKLFSISGISFRLLRFECSTPQNPKNVAGFVTDFWRNEVQNSAGAEHPIVYIPYNIISVPILSN